MKKKRGANNKYNSLIIKTLKTNILFFLILIMLVSPAYAAFEIDKSTNVGISNHVGGSDGYARITLCNSTNPPLSLAVGAVNNGNGNEHPFVEYLSCVNASSSQNITPVIDFNAPLDYAYAKVPNEDFFCADGLRSDMAACGMGGTYDSSNSNSWLQTIVCCQVHDAYINYDSLKRKFLDFYSSTSQQTKSCPNNYVVCGAKEDPQAIDFPPNSGVIISSRVTGVYCCPVEQETEASCKDGTDRDNDTFIGCADDDCLGFTGVNGEACESSESSCNDARDTDRDGFTDFEDKDCYNTVASTNGWDAINGPVTFSMSIEGDKNPTTTSNFNFNPSSTTGYDGVCGDDTACVSKQTISSCSDITDKTTCESSGCTYTTTTPATPAECVGGTFCYRECPPNDQFCQGCDQTANCNDMDETECNSFPTDCQWNPATSAISTCEGTLTSSVDCASLSKDQCVANSDCKLSSQTDLYFFDPSSKFFCNNDFDGIDAITASPASWKWWDATVDEPFKIHKIIVTN